MFSCDGHHHVLKITIASKKVNSMQKQVAIHFIFTYFNVDT